MITAVHFKEANAEDLNGYIRFSVVGDAEPRSDIISAPYFDNNSIITVPRMNDTARQIRDHIENVILSREILIRQKNPSAELDQLTPARELKKFKELVDSGSLTQEEIEMERKGILGLLGQK